MHIDRQNVLPPGCQSQLTAFQDNQRALHTVTASLRRRHRNTAGASPCLRLRMSTSWYVAPHWAKPSIYLFGQSR